MEVPLWHMELLDERQRLIDEGKAEFVDWEVAKEQIRETILRLNLALAEAHEDLEQDRVYSAEAFAERVQDRWPGATPPEAAPTGRAKSREDRV